MRKLTDAQVGYIAGIIDGEGSIRITKSKSSRTKSGLVYQIEVSIVSVTPRMLEWIVETTGFGIVKRMKKRSDKHRVAWRLRILSRQAEQLLRATMPYLLIKWNQASIVVNGFVEMGLDGAARFPDHVWISRDLLYRQVKELNLRGADAIARDERKMSIAEEIEKDGSGEIVHSVAA